MSSETKTTSQSNSTTSSEQHGLITDRSDNLNSVSVDEALLTSLPVAENSRVPTFETIRVVPGGSHPFYINGKKGTSVTVFLERQALSGGHNHGSAQERDAVGVCVPSTVQINGPWPQNVPLAYTAPLGAGIVTVRAQFSTGTVSQLLIEALISGLIPIAASDSLVLKPPTPEHPSPYWVTPSMNQKLVALGSRYAAARGKAITVTDAALVWGGRFDLDGGWLPPHAEHRDGNQVDVRSRDMTDEDATVFQSICSQVGLAPVLEGDHWHVRG